ncbi:MAG: HU family DNA-binding protein [Planctomycetaceae bacterium]
MAAPKSISKSDILNKLAEGSELNRKQVSAVLDALTKLVASQIGKKGVGVIAIPGLLKIQRISKPATKAKKGVPNPFKPGELMDVPAKPAKNVVKVRPLKSLKDMVQ